MAQIKEIAKRENIDREIIKRWINEVSQERNLDVALDDKENVKNEN